MNIGPLRIERALLQAARSDLHQMIAYLYETGVRMVDIGFNDRHGVELPEPAIRFHVERKLPDVQLEAAGRTRLQTLPMTKSGLPVNVIEGRYALHPAWGWSGGSRRARVDPLLGGVSVGGESYLAGTLGGIVLDRATRRPMILSNWHVLASGWGATMGEQVFQPGKLDGGSPGDRIGVFVRDGMASNLDAAVALLDSKRQLSYHEQLGLGAATALGELHLGMVVTKAGRSSAVTVGRVTGLGGVQLMRYGWLTRQIREVVSIDPLAGEVSRGGDSGAWWLERGTGSVLALHFAGSDKPERALAVAMGPVLDALGVTLPD